ncbi:MAG: AbrB/MazE/SpoVT family DNA-binding domain-containing protein [Proteobacteria bacterium]|nr:AbrB/MazE/SpoVT family DNA-binding domain-containing protein [Pseudomonadota bacterium]
MSSTLTVRKIGNSHGVILPKAELDQLGVGEGDKLFVVHTPDGIRLTPYDEQFARQVEAAEDFMGKYRDVFRELAK